MLIDNQKPIEVLKNVIEKLFKIEFDPFNFEMYDIQIPHALKEMYEIEAFFEKKDEAYASLGFFSMLDKLIPFQALNTENETLTFIEESQSNWALQYQNGKVFFEDRLEPENSYYLSQSIEEILLLFGLQEIGFNITNYLGLDYDSIDEIISEFENIEQIVINKNYIGLNCSFYIVDGNCLLGQASMNVLSTFDVDKYHFYKTKFRHYTF
jgi:hypothetical protein